jgi:hypothetical protein
MRNRLSATVIVVATALASPAISAAAPPQESPAQALFDRGVADMDAGRFEKACPAIEASQRMEPMPGTLFTLAECEAKRGRTATAIRYYGEYLALYRAFSAKKKHEQKDRAETSEAQLKKLQLLAPRLTLVLPKDGAADVVVKRNGDVVADLSLGTALVVNPGEHLVTTQVPGGPVMEHRVSLSPGESKTLTLTVRRDALLDSEGQRSDPDAGLVPPQARPDLRPWRIGTWSAGAVAVVGLAVGAVTGILAIRESTVVSDNCGPGGACNGAGIEAVARLKSFGTASTIGFVIAGVGVVAGVTLLVAAPSAPTPSQGVGNAEARSVLWSPFGMTVRGNF